MKQYMRGATARLAYQCFRHRDNVQETPTSSHTLDLWDSEGTKQVNGAATTALAAGDIVYYYNIGSSAAKGRWYGTFNAIATGPYTTKAPFEFEIVERIDVE